jgi:adenylate cyclase
MEELLNYIQDQGIDMAGGPALEALDLPASLHSLVLSRIDRLDEGPRATLRVASVVGRVFKASMLWDMHPSLGGAEQVVADLEVLRRLDLTPIDNEAEGVYLFKHIVTQEVAYGSLPFATRAGLHERVGQHIEAAFAAEGLEGQIDLLAHHYDRSENLPKRRTYLLRAGELAQQRYANAAAIDYFKRVLPLLPEGDQAPVMLKLGKVLELVGRWADAEELYAQASGLADRLGDSAARAACATATGDLLRKRGRYDEAATWFAQARAGFEVLADRAGVGEVCHHAGTLSGQQGDFASARRLFEESLAIRRELGDRLNAASLLNNLANIARAQGNPELARSLQEECLAVRQEMNDRWGLAIAHNNLGNLAIDRGDFVSAYEHFDEALAIMRTVGDRWLTGNFLNNQGNAARAQGDFPRARGLYAESLLIYRDFSDRWALAYLLEDVGGMAACEGQAERALRLAGHASRLRESIGAPLSAVEHSRLERLLAPARQALPNEGAAAWQEGQALPLEQAIEEALAALCAQQI